MVSLFNELDPRLRIEEQTTKMLLAAGATLTPRLAPLALACRESNSATLHNSNQTTKETTNLKT